MRFKDKVVVITGAAGEMAQEMTRQVIKEGGFVVTLGVRASTLDPFLDDLKKENLLAFKRVIANISNQEEIENIIEEVIKEHKKIDILINHVGVTKAESLNTTSVQLWKDDIEININGTFYITNACLVHMKKAKQGNIITIGSVNSDRCVGNPAYSASKAALVQYMNAIATEYGQYNIRANTVSPGSVRTKAWDFRIKNNPETFDNLLKWYPLKRIATPACISKATLFLASDDAFCISGVNLRVDAGLSAGVAPFAKDITSESFGV
ncbi:MAG: SDR family oxidoreductase [Campylobacteraceae bacterium]|nr:SDR family oxidoreductase [Campylobacteraceae bacterium]